MVPVPVIGEAASPSQPSTGAAFDEMGDAGKLAFINNSQYCIGLSL